MRRPQSLAAAAPIARRTVPRHSHGTRDRALGTPHSSAAGRPIVAATGTAGQRRPAMVRGLHWRGSPRSSRNRHEITSQATTPASDTQPTTVSTPSLAPGPGGGDQASAAAVAGAGRIVRRCTIVATNPSISPTTRV